jgi:hypothetical protein
VERTVLPKAEESPVKRWFMAIGPIFFVLAATAAATAQVTVDVSKVTCNQALLGHIGMSIKSVPYWLSGYYNGKRDNTVIEVAAMRKNVRTLADYCRKHRDMPVMEAAKAALGLDK